jgi:hypothetical protein
MEDIIGEKDIKMVKVIKLVGWRNWIDAAPSRGLTGITGSSPVLTTIEIEILNRFGIVS